METGISLFDALESISPWWWVALGIAIGALEMLTMSFFLKTQTSLPSSTVLMRY